MADPESDVLAAISGNVGSWVENTNLFRGPVRAAMPDSIIPVNAVFVLNTGGPEPINFARGGSTPQEYEHNIQIVVRGEPDKYGSTRTQAVAIYSYLHDNDPSGYIYLRATMPAPVYVGTDERRCDYFVMNFRAGILE